MIIPLKAIETAKVKLVNVMLQWIINILMYVETPLSWFCAVILRCLEPNFKLCDLVFEHNIDTENHGLIFGTNIVILVNILCILSYYLEYKSMKQTFSILAMKTLFCITVRLLWCKVLGKELCSLIDTWLASIFWLLWVVFPSAWVFA